MSKANLEQFYQEVLKDQALQERFRTVAGSDSVAALAVELGQEKGYSFTAEEVQAYLDEMNASDQELSDELLEAVAGGAQTQIYDSGCGGGNNHCKPQ